MWSARCFVSLRLSMSFYLGVSWLLCIYLGLSAPLFSCAFVFPRPCILFLFMQPRQLEKPMSHDNNQPSLSAEIDFAPTIAWPASVNVHRVFVYPNSENQLLSVCGCWCTMCVRAFAFAFACNECVCARSSPQLLSGSCFCSTFSDFIRESIID